MWKLTNNDLALDLATEEPLLINRIIVLLVFKSTTSSCTYLYEKTSKRILR